MLWIPFGLVLVFMIGYCFAVPSEHHETFGIGMLIVGSAQMLFHRQAGQLTFDRNRKMFRLFFWEALGVEGSRQFYFGIGLIIALAGAVVFLFK
ncbi:MAG TPA: hypothetical protein VJN22_01190 [Candidatus Eremiobacteraceae bacterium]|nr:hypothetical protein [Candidatus Eremiobacteraceae bacterium]